MCSYLCQMNAMLALVFVMKRECVCVLVYTVGEGCVCEGGCIRYFSYNVFK